MSTEKQLAAQVAAMVTEHAKAQAARISTLEIKIRKLTRQRDEARGRANEYRAYADKYQKELAEMRKANR